MNCAIMSVKYLGVVYGTYFMSYLQLYAPTSANGELNVFTIGPRHYTRAHADTNERLLAATWCVLFNV